jgi:4a-hydroxytetrahydrobiopterin dehydratase
MQDLACDSAQHFFSIIKGKHFRSGFVAITKWIYWRTSMALTDKKCVPCEGGVEPFDDAKTGEMLKQIPGWDVSKGHLYRQFKFKNFVENMVFINKVADLAEAERHHPDFCVHYNRVEFDIWTHAIGGLSENDFILAAKISELAD